MLKSAFAGAALALLISASANAAIVYVGPSIEQGDDTSFSVTFNNVGGNQSVSFLIDGYGSLDGQNFFEDDFALTLNGAATPVMTGAFNLGGGGADVLYSAPVGTTASNLGNVEEAIGIPSLNLASGLNTLIFSYTSLVDGHNGPQSLGDEGWGVARVDVSNVAASAPEPAAWAMMLLGVAVVGGGLRARRSNPMIA